MKRSITEQQSQFSPRMRPGPAACATRHAMRWAGLSALSLGLLLAGPLRAQQDGLPDAAARAKSLPAGAPLVPDAFEPACERARQIALQGLDDRAPQRSPRFFSLDVDRDRPAGVVYAWSLPDAPISESRALVVAARILTGDPGTHLNRQLMGGRRLAHSTRAWLDDGRGPDVFLIQIAGVRTDRIEEIEGTVEGELGRLGSSGPEPWELERARAGLELELDGAAVPELAEAFRSVTREDVKRAVFSYLPSLRKTTVEVRPRGSPEPWVPGPADILPPPFRLHTMKKGETLKAVARRHGIEAKTLAKINGLEARTSPYVGQTLKIPRTVPKAAAASAPAAKATAERAPVAGSPSAKARASKVSASKKLASKTPAGKTPASKKLASKTSAGKTPAGKTPATHKGVKSPAPQPSERERKDARPAKSKKSRQRQKKA